MFEVMIGVMEDNERLAFGRLENVLDLVFERFDLLGEGLGVLLIGRGVVRIHLCQRRRHLRGNGDAVVRIQPDVDVTGTVMFMPGFGMVFVTMVVVLMTGLGLFFMAMVVVVVPGFGMVFVAMVVMIVSGFGLFFMVVVVVIMPGFRLVAVPLVMVVIMRIEICTFPQGEVRDARGIHQFDNRRAFGHGADRLCQRRREVRANPEDHIRALQQEGLGGFQRKTVRRGGAVDQDQRCADTGHDG